MNCPNCGAVMISGAQFCGACGTRMPPPAQESSASEAPNVSSGWGATPGGGGAAGHGIHIDADARGQGRGYSFEILHQPSFALAVVRLQAEQSILAEAGAMVSMSANVELQSQMKGGLMGALKRAVGGESAFVSTFTARGGPGEVSFAPGAPGDIAAIELSNQMFMVQSSSYLAGDASLTVDTKWGGAKTFFGGEGLFVMQVQGTGLLLVSSFGARFWKERSEDAPATRRRSSARTSSTERPLTVRTTWPGRTPARSAAEASSTRTTTVRPSASPSASPAAPGGSAGCAGSGGGAGGS